MPCRLLHVIEQPDPDPYRDPELKDVVGAFPSFYCANCTPLRPLLPGETVKCLERAEPCWKRPDRICEE